MIRVTEKFVLFYKEWPSNFKKTSFSYDYNSEGKPKVFFCTEQAFMYCKARFFNDLEVAQKILECKEPWDAKHFGRQVHNYIDVQWDKVRYQYMRDVNLERFRQDLALREKLLNPIYNNKTFVEASPVDLIWGVGLEQTNPLIDDEKNWKGKNLLGKALTEVRRIIIKESCK